MALSGYVYSPLNLFLISQSLWVASILSIYNALLWVIVMVIIIDIMIMRYTTKLQATLDNSTV